MPCCAAAVLCARGLGWLQPAELAAYDRLAAAWAGDARNGRILLVLVTEADIARFGWPLRDEILATLLQRLTGWGARAVGVDIYRDRPLPPGSQALADLLAQHPEIAWVCKLPDKGGGPGVAPPAVLAGSPRAVLADAGDDAALGNGRVVLVAEPFGPYAQVDAAGYQTLLDFRGGRDRFGQVSLGALMGATPPLLWCAGVSCWSARTRRAKDSFATPLGPGRHGAGPLSGVALHAHLADQLIRLQAGEPAGRTVLPRAADMAIVWACATAAAAGLALPAAGLAFAAVVLAGAGLIAWAAHAAFGAAGLVLPAVPAVLAWLGAAAGAVWALHEAAYAALRAGRPEAGALFRALDEDDPCAAFHCARLAAGESGVRVVMKEK